MARKNSWSIYGDLFCEIRQEIKILKRHLANITLSNQAKEIHKKRLDKIYPIYIQIKEEHEKERA